MATSTRESSVRSALDFSHRAKQRSGDRLVFRSPDAALLRPRQIVRLLVRFRERLGLPEPDRYWETTAQVNWYGTAPAGLLARVWCLYAGHDLRRHGRPESRLHGLSERSVCDRCHWEGPWR